MKRSVVLCLCLLNATLALRGQSPAPPAAASAPSVGEEPSFTIELLHTRVRFENDGTGTRELVLGIKVLDEQAVRRWGQIALPYQSESEDLQIRTVEVKKPDGSVSSTGESGIQDLSAVPPALAPTFLDLRQKAITVSALRPGDVVTVSARWSTKKPIAPGHFWFQHSFERGASVADERLEIDVPAKRSATMKIGEGAPAEESRGSGAVSGERRVYRWKRAFRFDATKPPKPVPQGEDHPPADVRLSSFANWNEFAAWFSGLASKTPDGAITAKAAALTKGAIDDAAKISAIYRFVSSEIRYVSLSFGVGRFAAHPPPQVLSNQYGDCKDKAMLLQSLLAAAGVRSVSVLLNSTRSISEDLPSPLEFDHMVSMVRGPGGADIWLDPTLEVAPVGLLAAGMRDKNAFLVDDGARGRVIRTPADPPFPSLDRIELDGTVNPLGVLVARVVFRLRGDSEVIARSIVRSVPRTALKDVVAALAAEHGLDGELSEVSSSDPADTAAPFELRFHLRRGAFLDWARDRSKIATLPRTALAFSKEEERKDLDRLFFGSPTTVRLRAQIELPEGYEFDALPQPVRLARAGNRYQSTYTVNGRRLAIEREITTAERGLPSSAFSEYAALVAAIDSDFAQTVAVRSDVAAIPEPPKDTTADELYRAAYSAYEAKRYDAAVALWKRNTEIAPKMANAWSGLGFAYDKLARYDEAVAALQKQIELDPNAKRAHSDLGSVLKNAGKNDAAANAYARHLQLNPLDGEAFKELGFLYNDLRRYSEAVAALEKGAGLLPRHAWIQAELASAYLHVKETEKGRQAVNRVMELSPNVAVRTYVAWSLAEHGLDLDRAENLARITEQEVTNALKSLELTSVEAKHLDLVESLAWLWDTIGWTHFQRGNLEQAERYALAAWQLLGHQDVAFHLGRISEKRNRLADALSYYLTAQAVSTSPTLDMIAHVKRLAGGGDLKLMMKSAKDHAVMERAFALTGKGAGSGEFLALLASDGPPIAVRFLRGTAELKSFADVALREARYPVSFPVPGLRLPVGVKVACDPQQNCRGFVEFADKVTLDR